MVYSILVRFDFSEWGGQKLNCNQMCKSADKKCIL